MIIGECCEPGAGQIYHKMRNQVSLNVERLSTNTNSGIQKNNYEKKLVLTKRCYIKDRSQAAQETAVNNGVQNLDTVKELIFQYFPATDYKFNEIVWAGATFKVFSVTPIASITIERIRFVATNQQPFISIIVGLKNYEARSN